MPVKFDVATRSQTVPGFVLSGHRPWHGATDNPSKRETCAMLTEKSREDRIRRLLRRDGYRLMKTPARSWRREAYGVGYMIMDDRGLPMTGYTPNPYSDTLEEVEDWATE